MTETTAEYVTETETGYKKLTTLEFYNITRSILAEHMDRLKFAARIPDNTRDARRYTDAKNAARFLEDLKRGAKNAY